MNRIFNRKPQSDQVLSNISEELTKEDLEVFLQINSVLLKEVEITILLKNIVDLTIKHLGCVGALFIRYDEHKRVLYPQIVSQGAVTDIAIKLLGDQLQSFEQHVDGNETLAIQSFNQKKTLVGNRLSEFISPPAPKAWASMTQLLYRMQTIVSVPVFTKQSNFGVIVYSFNQTNEELGKRTIKVLELYTSQVAAAIERASIYENISLKLNQIQAKNSDLQSLYNLSSKVSNSLDPNLVAQTAVNSLPQDKFIVGSIISIFDNDTNALHPIAVTQNELAHQAQSIVGDFTKIHVSVNDIKSNQNLAIRSFVEEKKIYSNHIDSYLEPALLSSVVSKLLKLISIKSIAIHPITWKNETHGLITYFIKDKTAEEVTDSEKQLLDTYTSHIAIALENAELYKKQKKIQEELQKAYKQVQSLRQHEQDMIDIMGHELRTPITIVRNSLGVMEMEFKKNGTIPADNLERYIDIAMESARREVRLVETLLSSAKADSRGFQLMFEKVDMVDVIQDSMELFKKEGSKKGLEVIFNTTGEYFVYADRVRCQEITDNLLSNAVKYTDEGKIEVSLRKENGFVIIEVSDTGIGMSEDDKKKLGKKFYRVDQYISKANEKPEEIKEVIRPGGTGLGLYVTFSLVKIMDGTYEVQSEVGKGSKFTIKLPEYTDQPNKQEQRKVDEEEEPKA